MNPSLPLIRLAYGSVPKDCGTFTFYRNLRASLLPHGVKVICVSVGQHEAGQWDPAFADENCVQLAAETGESRAQAQAFVDWAIREAIDLVMPINSTALLSALPHLPAGLQAVMRCANAYPHGYELTVLNQAHAASIVGTTPRHMEDLATRYQADSAKLTLIPHGIDPTSYEQLPIRSRGPVLNLGFLGRLEHNQKGALYLPGIVRRLEALQIPFKLRIAGAGRHRPEMEELMAHSCARGSVEFVGRLIPQDIPAFLAGVDVFLFPSRFEGFGFSLVEAMMAGSVPLVSRIPGITDFIIEEGVTGLLCEIGDEAGFANAVARLHADRELLENLSAAAARAARARFTSARMSADYAQLFRRLVESPMARPAPLPWSEFRLPTALRRRWQSRLPQPLRRLAREIRAQWSAATGNERGATT